MCIGCKFLCDFFLRIMFLVIEMFAFNYCTCTIAVINRSSRGIWPRSQLQGGIPELPRGSMSDPRDHCHERWFNSLKFNLTFVSRFFRHDSKTHGIHFPLTGLSAQGFKISVTSDGHRYSQEALFIVADGYCTKCTAAGVCTYNVGIVNVVLLKLALIVKGSGRTLINVT